MIDEYKWQLILTDSGYTDFNMWVPLGCKIASKMLDLLKKRKHCVEEINLIMIL